MPVPARVSFVTLAVRDLSRMAAFYRQFGWPESKGSSEEFVAFQCGGAVLGLFGADYYSRHGRLREPGTFGGIVLAINLEEPRRVDDVYETIRRFQGARLAGAPEDLDFGGRGFEFADPEGNVWEVVWAPGTSFDECGGLIFP